MLGQRLAGPTTSPRTKYTYLSAFVVSRIGLGKRKDAGETSKWMFPATTHFPQSLGPGEAVAPAPLGGSTELVKKLWRGGGPSACAPSPTLGPGNPLWSMFPSGAFHHMFLLAPASWHQELGSFDSAFCFFYFFSVHFPRSF